MTAEEAAMIMMSGGDSPPVNDKLEEICNSKILPINGSDIIPIDNTLHLSIHARYTEDCGDYNSGMAWIVRTASSPPDGSTVHSDYTLYYKQLQVWMVCWKNNKAQYATLLNTAIVRDEVNIYHALFDADDKKHSYSVIYYTTYYRPIMASLAGGGGGLGFSDGTQWLGNITAVITFQKETYEYVPAENRVGDGYIELNEMTPYLVQINMGSFLVAPIDYGCVTSLSQDSLARLVEDLYIAIHKLRGEAAEKPTVLKPKDEIN